MKRLLLLLPWVLVNRQDFEGIVKERNVAVELVEKLRNQLTDVDVQRRSQAAEIKKLRGQLAEALLADVKVVDP